jgi:hypothetical protein
MGIARLSVLYLVLCEWLFGALLGLYVLMSLFLFLKEHTISLLLVAFVLALLALICFATGRGLLNHSRWSWFGSLVIGFGVMALGLFSIWTSGDPMPNARGEEGWGLLCGVAFLLPSICGLVLLIIPHVRRDVLQDESSLTANPLP